MGWLPGLVITGPVLERILTLGCNLGPRPKIQCRAPVSLYRMLVARSDPSPDPAQTRPSCSPSTYKLPEHEGNCHPSISNSNSPFSPKLPSISEPYTNSHIHLFSWPKQVVVVAMAVIGVVIGREVADMRPRIPKSTIEHQVRLRRALVQ